MFNYLFITEKPFLRSVPSWVCIPSNVDGAYSAYLVPQDRIRILLADVNSHILEDIGAVLDLEFSKNYQAFVSSKARVPVYSEP